MAYSVTRGRSRLVLFFKTMGRNENLISKEYRKEDALKYEGYPEFYPPGRLQAR
jgi:hypothetical protein